MFLFQTILAIVHFCPEITLTAIFSWEFLKLLLLHHLFWLFLYQTLFHFEKYICFLFFIAVRDNFTLLLILSAIFFNDLQSVIFLARWISVVEIISVQNFSLKRIFNFQAYLSLFRCLIAQPIPTKHFSLYDVYPTTFRLFHFMTQLFISRIWILWKI